MSNFKEGLKGGRPRIYKTPKQMEKRLEEYFEDIDGVYEDGKMIVPPKKLTITGLALFLGFADKSSMYDYQQIEGFSPLIKRARTFIERYYEERLMSKASTGAIFGLKNMGWSDKTEVEQTITDTRIKL